MADGETTQFNDKFYKVCRGLDRAHDDKPCDEAEQVPTFNSAATMDGSISSVNDQPNGDAKSCKTLPRLIILTDYTNERRCTCGKHGDIAASSVRHKVLWCKANKDQFNDLNLFGVPFPFENVETIANKIYDNLNLRRFKNRKNSRDAQRMREKDLPEAIVKRVKEINQMQKYRSWVKSGRTSNNDASYENNIDKLQVPPVNFDKPEVNIMSRRHRTPDSSTLADDSNEILKQNNLPLQSIAKDKQFDLTSTASPFDVNKHELKQANDDRVKNMDRELTAKEQHGEKDERCPMEQSACILEVDEYIDTLLNRICDDMKKQLEQEGSEDAQDIDVDDVIDVLLCKIADDFSKEAERVRALQDLLDPEPCIENDERGVDNLIDELMIGIADDLSKEPTEKLNIDSYFQPDDPLDEVEVDKYIDELLARIVDDLAKEEHKFPRDFTSLQSDSQKSETIQSVDHSHSTESVQSLTPGPVDNISRSSLTETLATITGDYGDMPGIFGIFCNKSLTDMATET